MQNMHEDVLLSSDSESNKEISNYKTSLDFTVWFPHFIWQSNDFCRRFDEMKETKVFN